mgnify:CR=1 FL=1
MAALTPSQLDQLSEQLRNDYQALLSEVRRELENVGRDQPIDLVNREPGDVGDESVVRVLADLNLATLDRHVQELQDIEAAFQRFRTNQYGTCADCSCEIGFDRLQAYPTAKRCLMCQQQHEREHVDTKHPTL